MQTVEAEDYHDFSRLSHPAVSPDGDRVAFVKQTPDTDTEYAATVYVASVGGDEARRFTVAEGVDSEPAWSPSGDRLAFVSTRGADDDRPQLWVLPVEGGEAEQVTDVVGGVSSIAWGPDGDRIAFLQGVRPEERDDDLDLAYDDEYEREDPDPRVIDRHVYRSHESYADGARSHVYLADLDAGEVERVTEGVADCLGPAWGDSDLYYPIRRGVDGDDRLAWEIEAFDPETGGREVVTTVEGWGPTLAVSGSRIAYTTTPADDPTLAQTEVDVFDRATGETERLTADLDRTLELWNASHAPEWGPDGDYLYVCTPDEGSYVLRRLGHEGDELVLGGDRHVHGFSVARDAVGVVQSEWDHPGDVVAATPAGGEENRLTRANSDYLDDRAVSQPEEISVDAPGGEVQGWVLTPPDFDPDEEYPLVVEVHGGPHRMWSTTGSMWHEFQTLAARGYVVFWCNPRGSSGYGQSFMRSIERDWGDVTFEDVMAGSRQVADRDYVDAENAFVTGGSFGGFMTAWAVGHTDFFAGAVAQRGVYDLSGFYGSTDAYKLVEGDFGTVPWDEPEFLWEQSPVAHVENVDTPTLVVHAENDYRTPANTAELFYLSLRKQGVDTRMVRYPREGHELSRSGEPGHVVDRIERIARWFDGYSAHHDAERALDRERNDGLSAGESGEDENPER
ncbi:S9 family peptidase [Halobacterium litoreum]|uniref:S9 family peptidase n=1 Tax=Halobacterium litoreum TaxID=2039234 RepID=A0ABD5NEK4_9EURY|nr:S9 family peptidase [Halobacterium litoreum]UHH13435.1 S9 family peptidase [Halobacterium litoreum]